MGASLLDSAPVHEHVWFANPKQVMPRDILQGLATIEHDVLVEFGDDIGLCQYRLCRVCGLLESRWTNLDGEWRPLLRLAKRLMEGTADGD